MNLCSGCGEDFNSIGAFDMHRIGKFGQGWSKGTRRCMSPDEMIAKGMVRNVRGRWTTGAFPEGVVFAEGEQRPAESEVRE